MSIIYIVLAIIIAIVITSVIFVIIGKVEHKHRHINLNWLVLMTAIILGCALVMVLIYHSQHDLTTADIQQSYDRGYEAGVASENHTYPSNEEVEEWMSSTQEVIVSTHKDGSDPTIHIIDQKGDEWVLYAD